VSGFNRDLSSSILACMQLASLTSVKHTNQCRSITLVKNRDGELQGTMRAWKREL
jgi:hypothetical protein